VNLNVTEKVMEFFISAMVLIDLINRISEVAKRFVKYRGKWHHIPRSHHKRTHKPHVDHSVVQGSLKLYDGSEE